MGTAVSSPAGSGAEPQQKLNLVPLKWHLVSTILMIFLKNQLTKFIAEFRVTKRSKLMHTA